MTDVFYFDESGHSGDLTKTGDGFDFLDQPFFVLAAVGVPDASKLATEVAALRALHRIPAGELKSKSLTSKPEFVAALFDMARENDLPLFVEVVDKKYFLGTSIVQWLLFPPVMGFPEDARSHFLKNTMAQFLYDEASDHVLNRFIQACLEPSDHTLMSAYGSLLLLSAATAKKEWNQGLMDGLRRVTEDTCTEYCELRVQDATAYERFLPPPDYNRQGKSVWILPNLSSFTNICARINKLRHRNMSGVRLVHDQQLEVAEILRQGKASLEKIKTSKLRPFTPHADYIMGGEATLEFESSHGQIGIQLADVIAGTTMRYYRDRVRAPKDIHPAIARVMRSVVRESNPDMGVWLNLVGPDELVVPS